MESSSIITLVAFLAIIEAAVIFMLIGMGGKLLKAKLKATLPWNKNKGRFWLHLYKTGTFILDYVIMDKESKIMRKKEHDILVTGDNNHSFIDKTAFENHVTIHKLDKQPLVFTVEGAPTDVLVQYRDYEQDISKMASIEKYLQKVITEDNPDNMQKATFKMIDLFYNLLKAFKYLPVAKQYCISSINEYNEDHMYNNKEYAKLLTKYMQNVRHLRRELNNRNFRFVNFTEYFNKSNISGLFNKKAREWIQLGRASVGTRNKTMDKAIKIGGTIVFIAMAFMGYMLLDQGNQLEEMNNAIQTMSNKIKDATVTVSSDNAGEDDTTPSSSPVKADAQAPGIHGIPWAGNPALAI